MSILLGVRMSYSFSLSMYLVYMWVCMCILLLFFSVLLYSEKACQFFPTECPWCSYSNFANTIIINWPNKSFCSCSKSKIKMCCWNNEHNAKKKKIQRLICLKYKTYNYEYVCYFLSSVLTLNLQVLPR